MIARKELLRHLEETAGQLVAVAERLKNITQASFTEEELEPLQQQQEQLITRLIEADTVYRTQYSEHAPHSDPKSEKIKKLLEHFQTLNAAFLENVHRAKGVIQFEDDLFRKTSGSLREIHLRFLDPDHS